MFKKKHVVFKAWKGDFPVCVVRPLHGAWEKTGNILATLCVQHFSPTEIRYGVDDDNDPSIRIVNLLKEKFPHIPMSVLIATSRNFPNRKIANLSSITDKISAPVIVALDQDIRVSPAYLENILSPFSNAKTGMVTALYRIANPETIGSAFELLSVHVDFFPSVLVAELLENGLKFAFGATIAIRKEVLEKMGGFESVGDYLADDHELGLRVAKAGYDLILSGEIVEHDPGKLSLRDYWSRQLRAARTHRVCRPGGYALSVLTQGVPWVAGLFLAIGFSPLTLGFFLAWLASRALLAVASHTVLKKKEDKWWPLFFLPLHELMRLAFWLLAFTGNNVAWGGKVYHVFRDGTMKVLD